MGALGLGLLGLLLAGVARARELGCRSVAFTYNDPVIFHEYAVDVAAACKELGAEADTAKLIRRGLKELAA